MILVSCCRCLCPINWSQVLSRSWRCSWSSADRRCSNYIWVIDKFIAYEGASYIRDLTVAQLIEAEWWRYELVTYAIIVSDNGLSPVWCQAISWTNTDLLSIGPLGTNFGEISIKINTLSFKEVHLKMSSGRWWPFCLALNVLKQFIWYFI